VDERADKRESGRETLARSLACTRCRYDLRGLPLDGHCPECGATVWESVEGAIDPTARRLPTLTNPRKVGDALVLFVACLLLGTLLVLARPVLGAVGAFAPSGVAPPPRTLAWLMLLASGVAALSLIPVRMLAPPADAGPRGAASRTVRRLVLGVVTLFAATLAWAFVGDAAIPSAIVRLAVVLTLIMVMAALRSVLLFVGERSREFRTASARRQRVPELIAALVGAALGDVARVAGDLLALRGLSTLGTLMVWICLLMFVIGLCYLLVNTGWIRRSLRRPPPTVGELVGERGGGVSGHGEGDGEHARDRG
jgi:hypothetical protein